MDWKIEDDWGGFRDIHQRPDRAEELGIEHHTAISLQTLPNELIQEIIKLAPHPQTSLSICSKRFHTLTTPILYSNVSLTYHKSYPFFLRTISCRPDLISHVRHFHTSAYTPDWDFDVDFLTLNHKRWIRRSLPTVFGESACDHWFREIFAFRPRYRMLMAAAWDAITAFLLCLFSGLQSIDMKPYGLLVAKYSHIDMVLEQASWEKAMMKSMTQNILSNLRSVSIESSQQSRRLSIYYVLPFLEVNSVRRVRASSLMDDVWSNLPFPSVLETTDLALLNSHLSPGSIQRILSLFSSLKRFQYQYGIANRQHHHLLSPPLIIKESLLGSRNTLEQLMISDDRREPYRDEILISGTAIGSLRQFSRLSVIKADALILLGEEYRTDTTLNTEVGFGKARSLTIDQCIDFIHSLPTSLEHLTIWKNTTAIVKCLGYMFPVAGNGLPPHFKSMTLFFRSQITAPSDSEMEEWAERASKLGVVLQWERTLTGLPIDQWQRRIEDAFE